MIGGKKKAQQLAKMRTERDAKPLSIMHHAHGSSSRHSRHKAASELANLSHCNPELRMIE